MHGGGERTSSGLNALQGFFVDDARLALLPLALVPTLYARRFVNYHVDIAVSLAAGAQIQVDVHAVGSMSTDIPAADVAMAMAITVSTLTARSVAETGRRRSVGASGGGSAVPELTVASPQA